MIAFGGESGPTGITGLTEEWDGVSWSETTDLSTARAYLGKAGTQAAALAFTGNLPASLTTATEEWSDKSYTTETLG